MAEHIDSSISEDVSYIQDMDHDINIYDNHDPNDINISDTSEVHTTKPIVNKFKPHWVDFPMDKSIIDDQ